jgi:tetratricopeptide (TPR) repeat protein
MTSSAPAIVLGPRRRRAFVLAALLAASASGMLAAEDGASTSANPPAVADRAMADGLALVEQRRFAEAQTAFEAILARDPRSLEAAYQLGVLSLRRGEPEAAVRHLETALALAPDAARTHHNLGHAYGFSAARASLFSKLGLARKCLASYQRAVALAPAHVEYRMSLIAYYQSAPAVAGGGSDKALAAAEELRGLDPVRGSLTVIGVHVSTKQWSAAFAELARLREQSPGLREADYQFGRLAALSDLHAEEGIASLRRFLAAPPAPGDTPKAQACFRLGMLLEKTGQREAARTAYGDALAADPNHRLSREAVARLDGKAPSA